LSKEGIYGVVGIQEKSGFETTYVADVYWPWTFAEALDAGGKSLGNSTKALTSLPNMHLKQSRPCGEMDCFPTGPEVPIDMSNPWADESETNKEEVSCSAGLGSKISAWWWMHILMEVVGVVASVGGGTWLLLRFRTSPSSYMKLREIE
jgi:hypothetical protein